MLENIANFVIFKILCVNVREACLITQPQTLVFC